MSVLIERRAELRALTAAVDRATRSEGGTVVVLGPAGIGKSSLLRAAVPGASATPVRLLHARGGELEQDFPYGVLRQLYESVLRGMTPTDRDGALSGPARPASAVLLADGGAASDEPREAYALEHAAYWLTVHLAEKAPLALVVDDAHWSDLASLRALHYLARRLADLPVVLVVATRPASGARGAVLDRLVAGASSLLEPAPLSTAGVVELVHRQLATADDPFCTACHTASGGNPFLVTELVGAVRASGVDPVAHSAQRVRSIGARSVMRSVVIRLDGLSPDAAALAKGLAVVGEHHPSGLLGDVAGVGPAAKSAALDELRTAHLLEPDDPPRFVHDIVRDAVYEHVSPTDRSRLHLASAHGLSAVGAGPDAVAAHLLLTGPGADPWTFERLTAAASGPASSAAPEAVAAYLDRAMREVVPDVDRAPWLLALGAARYQIAGSDAVTDLSLSRDLARTPELRLDATRALASAYMTERRHTEAWSLLATTIAEFADEPDRARDLEIFSAQFLYTDIDADTTRTLLARVRAWTPDEHGAGARDRSMLAVKAWVTACGAAGGSATSEAATMAEAALSTGTLVRDDVWYVSVDLAVWALVMAGRYREAVDHLDTAIASCTGDGRVLRAATLLPMRAEIHRRLGRLDRALQDARQAADIIPPEQVYAPLAASALVLALVDSGDVAGARRVLADRGFDRDIPGGGMSDVLWFARGRLRVAEGEPAGGVDDLLAYGAVCERTGRRNPGLLPWRSTAVDPLLRLGRRDEAALLARDEAELAGRTGLPELLGRARLAVALADGPTPDAVRDAMTLLEASPLVLDAAQCRLTLGRVLRRAGRRDEARIELRAAAATAAGAGATVIAAAAHDELIVAGARPRRTAAEGVAALTPSESRVAALAAQGLTNREIAHSLFVTAKTVETHLAGAYRKLGIARKRELAAALADSGQTSG